MQKRRQFIMQNKDYCSNQILVECCYSYNPFMRVLGHNHFGTRNMQVTDCLSGPVYAISCLHMPPCNLTGSSTKCYRKRSSLLSLVPPPHIYTVLGLTVASTRPLYELPARNIRIFSALRQKSKLLQDNIRVYPNVSADLASTSAMKQFYGLVVKTNTVA